MKAKLLSVSECPVREWLSNIDKDAEAIVGHVAEVRAATIPSETPCEQVFMMQEKHMDEGKKRLWHDCHNLFQGKPVMRRQP